MHPCYCTTGESGGVGKKSCEWEHLVEGEVQKSEWNGLKRELEMRNQERSTDK